MPRKNKAVKHDPFRMVSNCQNKRRFATENEARKAAEDRMLMDMNASLSIYICHECGGWHLTSRRPDDQS